MLSFLVFALIVILIAAVLIYITDLLLGMWPGHPPNIQTIIRIIIVLIALISILQRALPLLGSPGLL
jgi:hypothetical protein